MAEPENPVRVVDTMPALASPKPLAERYPGAKDFNALANDQQREEVYYFAVMAATALNAGGQGPDMRDPKQMAEWLDKWSRDYSTNEDMRKLIHDVYVAHHPQPDQTAAIEQAVAGGLRGVIHCSDATLLPPPPLASVLDAKAIGELLATKAGVAEKNL